MGWSKIDDGYPDHPKVVDLSDRAFRVDITAWCYCSRFLTDGHLPETVLRRWASSKVITELVQAGRLDEVPSGFEVHDYLVYNPTRAEVLDQREKQRAQRSAAGKARAAGAQRAVGRFVGGDTNGSPAGSLEASTSPGPARTREGSEQVQNTTPGFALCTLLAELIEANGSKPPTVTKAWRDSARLMLERDHRDPAEAERLIRWCQGDEFWRSNVLSMPKFRQRYDQLRLQAKRDKAGGIDMADDMAWTLPAGGAA